MIINFKLRRNLIIYEKILMTQLMVIHGYSWFREAFRYNTHVHSCA